MALCAKSFQFDEFQVLRVGEKINTPLWELLASCISKLHQQPVNAGKNGYE